MDKTIHDQLFSTDEDVALEAFRSILTTEYERKVLNEYIERREERMQHQKSNTPPNTRPQPKPSIAKEELQSQPCPRGKIIKIKNSARVRMKRAIIHKDLESVEYILRDPNHSNIDFFGHLMLSITAGNIEALKLILKYGFTSLDREDREEGGTPLIIAVKMKSIDSVQLLIAAGANVNFVLRDNTTALHAAVIGGSFTMTTLLVEAGAHINSPAHKHNPFMTAVRSLHIDIAEFLYSKGGDPHISDGETNAFLALATRIVDNLEIQILICNMLKKYPKLIDSCTPDGKNLLHLILKDHSQGTRYIVNTPVRKIITVLDILDPFLREYKNKNKLFFQKDQSDYNLSPFEIVISKRNMPLLLYVINLGVDVKQLKISKPEGITGRMMPSLQIFNLLYILGVKNLENIRSRDRYCEDAPPEDQYRSLIKKRFQYPVSLSGMCRNVITCHRKDIINDEMFLPPIIKDFLDFKILYLQRNDDYHHWFLKGFPKK